MEDTNESRAEVILLGQESVLHLVHEILKEEQKRDDILHAIVLTSFGEGLNHINGLGAGKLVHRENIRDLCVKYRLRFLDAGHYKGSLPARTISALRRSEVRFSSPIKGFKIMAPVRCFRTSSDSCLEPYLFIPLHSGLLYVVDQRMPEPPIWRAWAVWPLRGRVELAMIMMAVAILIAAVLPSSLIGPVADAGWWGTHRIDALFLSLIFGMMATVLGWITFRGRFSADIWDSDRIGRSLPPTGRRR